MALCRAAARPRPKDLELANLPSITLAEVADATGQGIQRVCKRDSLVVGFLAHTGLSLDP
jgi:hypothetical protein